MVHKKEKDTWICESLFGAEQLYDPKQLEISTAEKISFYHVKLPYSGEESV